MTAIRTVQLQCDCGCTTSKLHGCVLSFPMAPISATAKTIREDAAKRGWQTVAHTTGSDICPPCRIAAIKAASDVTESGDNAKGEVQTPRMG